MSLSYANRMRSRMQKKMDLIGLKNLIHHSFLQFYKIEDIDTVNIFSNWLLSLEQDVLTKNEIESIRTEAKNAIDSGHYESIINKIEGGGSYAAKVKVEYLIDKINNY